MAAWLLDGCQAQGDGYRQPFLLRPHRKDHAAKLGITPETLPRRLRQFQPQGLLEMDGDRMRLTEFRAMRQLAERRPPRDMRRGR